MGYEQWEWVPGYEGFYEVSNFGNVRSVTRTVTNSRGIDYVRRGKSLKQHHGMVMLGKEGSRKYFNSEELRDWVFFDGEEPMPYVGARQNDFRESAESDSTLEDSTFRNSALREENPEIVFNVSVNVFLA